MNQFKKTVPSYLAVMLSLAMPLSMAQADEATTSVTTPGERHSTIEQTTYDQRKQQVNQSAQQAQQRAQTWSTMTPDERHQSYQQSAEQARNQADVKSDAAKQRKETWSQMSAQERHQLGASTAQNVQGNVQQRHEQIERPTSYGSRGWGGRR